MPTNLRLQKVNNTTELTLQVFQHSDEIEEVSANTDHSMVNDILVKKCTTADDYQEHDDENNNPFFCVRDKNDIYGTWLRIFDPEGLQTKVDIVHSGRNSYAEKFNVANGQTQDGRDAGLYLKVEWRDNFPDAARVLWIVGEIVTDVVMGDEVS